MSRNIVICCDGTTNEIAKDSTNVLRLYRCLKRDDSQIAFYDCGIGAISEPNWITQFVRKCVRLLDSAIALTVSKHVLDAYRFLVANYKPGDKIYLFGFSRGAYTARALAGLIRFLGLLRPELVHLDDLAWSLYSGDNATRSLSERFQGGNRFRKSFCLDDETPIHFVGVWDTVSSIGSFSGLKTLPYTADNELVNHVRHAVAINERRAMFQANHFRPEKLDQHESFKEVWFAGSHGDVGGGYPEKDGTISKVSLEWMLREAEECGLQLDDENRQHLLNNPPDHPPADELAAIHESLTMAWWLLELVRIRQYSQFEDKKVWTPPHLGAHRDIQSNVPKGTKPILHESVVRRIEELGFNPPNLPQDYDVEC